MPTPLTPGPPRPRARRLLALFLACALLPSTPLVGQDGGRGPSSVLPELRRVVDDCRAVARIRAVGGGGVQELRGDREIRIPYGVPYRFFHRVEDADFVLLRLEVTDGPGTLIAAAPAEGDPTCFTAALPALPMDRGVTLVESRGIRPSSAERAAMVLALDSLRSRFLARLFDLAYDEAIGQGRLRVALAEDFPALVDTTRFAGFVVRDPDAPGAPGGVTPLLDAVRSRFLEHAGLVGRAPHDISRARGLIQTLDAIRDPAGPCDPRALTPDQQQRLIRLADRLAPLRTLPDDDYGRLYADGTLPLDPVLLDGFAAAVRGACPHLPDSQITALTDIAVALTRDDLGPVHEAIRAAARLVEESYRILAVDGFGGATTTLQRFGQLDIVNAWFRGRDEARLLASFNLYPLALRFGGEVRPGGADPASRLLLTLGYSFATPVAGDDGDGDDGTAFTAGLSYRLNELIAIGAGRWFTGGDQDWYFSLAGDLGAIPFLRELFARLPDR